MELFVCSVVSKVGSNGYIFNLGYGVFVGILEEGVVYFFDIVWSFIYKFVEFVILSVL